MASNTFMKVDEVAETLGISKEDQAGRNNGDCTKIH